MEPEGIISLVVGILVALGAGFGTAAARRKWGQLARALGRGLTALADAWAPEAEPPINGDDVAQV